LLKDFLSANRHPFLECRSIETRILYHDGYKVVLQFGSVGLNVAGKCCSSWSVMKNNLFS